MKRLCGWLLLGALYAWAAPLMAAAPVLEACKVEFLSLEAGAEILEDVGSALTADQVMALPDERFKPAMAPWLPQGLSNSAFWLRMRLGNATAQPCERLLAVGAPRLNDIQVYRRTATGWQVMHAGSAYPLQSWPLESLQPLFPLELPAGAQIDVLVRVMSSSFLMLKPQLWSGPERLEHRYYHHLRDGVALGVAVLVLALSVVAGGLLRAWLVLAHAWLIFCYVAISVLASGYLMNWPTLLPWSRELLLLGALLLCSGLLVYLWLLLQVHRLARCWWWLYGAQWVLMTGCLAWAWLQNNAQGYNALLLLLQVNYALTLATLLAGWRRGLRYGAQVWLIVGLLLLHALPGQDDWELPWPGPMSSFSPISTLPGVLLLACSLLLAVNASRRKERRAVHALVRQKQAENARLEQRVAQRTEQLHESLRLRSSLLARISHDLRSPLVGIIDYARQLSAGGAGEQPGKIERSARQQLELIDELLEFSRDELQQLELLPSAGYLYGFLREVEEQGRDLAARQGNQFDCRLELGLPALVRADFRRLRQILLNLLGNAAKFTRDGQIGLSVSQHARAPAGTVRLRFCVSDTGIGIDLSKRDQLLQPFVRGANVGNHAGTGLGLAVVSQLLQHMHSALELDAVHGGGSRFSFDVLLDIATEQELEPGVGESHIADFCGAGRRLLVVDDVEHNREWLCDLLAGYGFDVLSANDGEHALQLLASETVELLVSDQWMPGLDAWGLLQALRQRGLHMPVLLYSATPPWRPAGVAPTLAFDACLLKPASTGELLKTLDRLLRVKHAVPAAGG